MVSSKESFYYLYLTNDPSIHMGDDSQIPPVWKDTIQFKHGVFNNVMYVPSLPTKCLSIYHMPHTGSPKIYFFGPNIVDISYISSGNLIDKGYTNHAFKEYAFSYVFTYSHQSSLLIHANEKIRLSHEIFGHMNFKYLQKLHNEEIVEGLTFIKFS